jgi:hypothetical protein
VDAGLLIVVVIALVVLAFLAGRWSAMRHRDPAPAVDVTPSAPPTPATGPPGSPPRRLPKRGGGPSGPREPRRPTPRSGSGAAALPQPTAARPPTRAVSRTRLRTGTLIPRAGS